MSERTPLARKESPPISQWKPPVQHPILPTPHPNITASNYSKRNRGKESQGRDVDTMVATMAAVHLPDAFINGFKQKRLDEAKEDWMAFTIEALIRKSVGRADG